MNYPLGDDAIIFISEQHDELLKALEPCPFCGSLLETRIDANTMWTGRRSSLVSVEIKHWCVSLEKQPSRAIIRAGRTLADAINAWNQRVRVTGELLQTERIVSAAMWFDGKVYSLPAPARHADIIRHFGGFAGPTTYGFLTNYDLFVDRHEAMHIAQKASQLLAPSTKPDLYTEDLW